MIFRGGCGRNAGKLLLLLRQWDRLAQNMENGIQKTRRSHPLAAASLCLLVALSLSLLYGVIAPLVGPLSVQMSPAWLALTDWCCQPNATSRFRAGENGSRHRKT